MNIYSAISSNVWKTNIILVLFIVFTGTFAYVIGKATDLGPSWGIIIFIISLIYSFISYFNSDKMVLATSGAKEINSKQHPQLFHLVQNLCIAHGSQMPKIYIIEDPSPNAFATGRDPKHAAIAFTTGILERLSKSELEGVIAHELSHVNNYDTRLLAITAVLVGFISLAGDMFTRHLFWGGLHRDRSSRSNAVYLVIAIVLAILAPIIASLIQLAISRKREFLADASGALLTRYPQALASALEKISTYPKPLQKASSATAHLYIVNPLKGRGFSGFISSLFSTHPPVEERIKILRSM